MWVWHNYITWHQFIAAKIRHVKVSYSVELMQRGYRLLASVIVKVVTGRELSGSQADKIVCE